MRLCALAVVVILPACASGPAVWTPAARTSPESCAPPEPSTAAPWQLVTTPTFTFCVPQAWSTEDGRTWRGPGGSVTWGTGRAPERTVVQRVEVRVRVPPGGGPPTRAEVEAAAAAQGKGPPSCTSYRHSERVGGPVATIYDNECDNRHMTGALWLDAGIYFQGEASDAVTASHQLQVFRSVRFLGTPAR